MGGDDMALTIQEENARLTVDGKSWDDVATDSGGGQTIDQLIVAEIEDLTGIDLPDIDDDTHVIVGYEEGDPVIYIEGYDEPFDLDDLDLDDLDLDWEFDTEIPIDGVMISVDVELNIKKDDLPDHIEIVTLPNKLTYYDGQTINITGMRVVPKREDDSTWTNSKYFRGYIPLQELIIDPPKADIEKVKEESIISTPWDDITRKYCPIPLGPSSGTIINITNNSNGTQTVWSWEIETNADVATLFCRSDGGIWTLIIASDHSFSGRWRSMANGNPSAWTSFSDGWVTTQYGKSAYYNWLASGGITESDFPLKPVQVYSDIGNDMNYIAWSMIYGTESRGGVQDIDVKWARYGDKEILTDTFEIEVEEHGGSGR